MARWSDRRYACARRARLRRQHGTTRIGAPRAPIRAAPLACLRHSRLADTRDGRRARAQGEAPASQQRSCLGALVPTSARCWVGRIGAVARREERERAGCSLSTDAGVWPVRSSRSLGTTGTSAGVGARTPASARGKRASALPRRVLAPIVRSGSRAGAGCDSCLRRQSGSGRCPG